MVPRPNAPIQRIQLGKYISPQPNCDGYILSYSAGKNPAGSAALPPDVAAVISSRVETEGPRKLVVPVSNINEQVSAALFELTISDIPLEQGPYADKNGKVQKLVEEVRRLVQANSDATSREAFLECVIDVLRPYSSADAEHMFPRGHLTEKYSFTMNPLLPLSEELPTAGSILAQEGRIITDQVTGAPSTIVTSAVEPYVLAAAVLRRLQVPAYPSLAVGRSPDGEAYAPLLAVIDPAEEDGQLQTFSLIRSHPPLGSVIVMSDVAVAAERYATLGFGQVMSLVHAMALRSEEKDAVYTPESFEGPLSRISDSLVESYRRWPDNHFMGETLSFLFHKASETLTMIPLALHGYDINDPNVGMRVPREMLQPIVELAGARANEIAEYAYQAMKGKLQAQGMLPPEGAPPV